MQTLQDYIKKYESTRLEDMEMIDLTDLEEMNIDREEIALELRIPESRIKKLFDDYLNDF